MAYYEGGTLQEKIARGPLAIDEALDIAIQIGQGLAEAHTAGVVHRDIKPANLMLTKGAQVKIVDFGLAKLAGQVGLTQTGKTLGTVAYMSTGAGPWARGRSRGRPLVVGCGALRDAGGASTIPR